MGIIDPGGHVEKSAKSEGPIDVKIIRPPLANPGLAPIFNRALQVDSQAAEPLT